MASRDRKNERPSTATPGCTRNPYRQPKKSQEELETYKKMNENLEQENNRLTSNVKILKKENKRLTEEKTALQNRLSTIAADRLTYANPNIADLSDEDRPTKLQEVYRRIYDNDWTDAFEELTTHKDILEKDAIEILLKIIMTSFHNCRKVTWGRYEKLVNVASSIRLEKETPLPCTEKEGALNEETACELNNREDNGIESPLTRSDTTSAEKRDYMNEHNGEEKYKAPADPKKGAEKNKTTGVPKNRGENIESTIKTNEVIYAEKEKTTKDSTSEHKTKKISEGNMNTTLTEKKGGENTKTSGYLKSIAEDTIKEDNANIDTGSNGKEEAAKEKMWSTNTSKDMTPNKKLDDGSEQQVKYSIQLNVDILHALKRIWKMASSELKGISVESICSVVVTNLDMPLESMPKTSKYLKSCVDLCWKMGVQEMPLHLEAIDEIDVKTEKKFDTDKFRHYTKSGRKVDYVVWPALYLYEGGPILMKGIAQGF